jgi:hypothetical protein
VSKTYRGHAETEDWSHGRAFRRPSKRKSESDWKRELRKESAVPKLDSVFIIINEWEPEDSEETLMEIVDSKFYTSNDAAFHALADIAEGFGIALDDDATAFEVPKSKRLYLISDDYYIQELNS